MIYNLPKWKCHKVVGAAKILSVSDPNIDPVKLALDNGTTVSVKAKWFSEKHVALSEDGSSLGYLVVYEGDGYMSWSPAKAFEEGYSPLADEVKHCGDKA